MSHDLIAAYALDAVDELERAQFERHLAGCDACRTELVRLRQATAAMAAAQTERPPAHLRDDVLQRVGDIPQEVRESRRPAQRPATTVARPTRLRQRASRHVRELALAAAALVAVVVVGVNVLAPQASPIDEVRAAALARNTTEVDRLLEMFADELVVHDTITDTGVSARVVRGDDGTVLITDGLPSLPTDRVYQAWLMDDEGPRPAGLLGREADPVGEVGAVDSGIQAVAVSVEPAGGSEQPSDQVVLTIPTA